MPVWMIVPKSSSVPPNEKLLDALPCEIDGPPDRQIAAIGNPDRHPAARPWKHTAGENRAKAPQTDVDSFVELNRSRCRSR